MIFTDILKAMQAGSELKNPAAWKKGQMLTTAVGTLVALVLQYATPDNTISPEAVNAITEAIAAVLVAVNLLITKASSKKI